LVHSCPQGRFGNPGLDALGAVRSLITEERDLPDAVRADNFLELFPRMREHIKRRNIPMRDPEPNEALHYP